MKDTLYTTYTTKQATILFLIGVFVAFVLGWAIAVSGIILPIILVVLAVIIPFVIAVVTNPRFGFISFIIYCFLLTLLGRYIGNFPFLYGIEVILVLCWIGVLFSKPKKFDLSNLKNDLCILGLLWFVVTVLQLGNPAGASLLGWISDARYSLLWLLCIPLCMVVFNKRKDLDVFIIIVISISLVAAIYGFKQQFIGLDGQEKAFVKSAPTHLIFGKLRVFSFYIDAGQFGASMAQMGVITLILALGPFKWWVKLIYALVGFIFVYAMMVSGTRGALFVLLIGMVVFLIVSKNLKLLIAGLVILIGVFCLLKYTKVLHGNAEVRRMRTALNPEDASLNVRIYNQKKLQQYLSNHPFGGGVGSIGYAGRTYNKGTYLAAIPPDSYWVKIWAMYGIVGLVIWFGIMMYILGKCCGIVWNIKDKGLKYKLAALTAGAAGIFFCSYGNEVMNMMPSAMLLYVSWAFVFIGPKLDKKLETNNLI